MNSEKVICLISLVLVIVGALNWGLHAFDLNVVESLDNLASGLLGQGNLSKIVYILVAVAGIVVAVQMGRKKIKACPDENDS